MRKIMLSSIKQNIARKYIFFFFCKYGGLDKYRPQVLFIKQTVTIYRIKTIIYLAVKEFTMKF